MRIAGLEKEAAGKDFWNDAQHAAAKSKELADLKTERAFWDALQSDIAYLEELANLDELDEEMRRELDERAKDLETKLDDLEFRLFLSGPYDKNGCYISVWSGAGGTDAQDWAGMLVRTYQRFCERRGWRAKILEEHKGEETGMKRATIQVDGDYAYGYLRGESGVHRLVRISPFSAQKLRHTSFAMVEIVPQIPEVAKDIEIKQEDIEMEAFRSSGPGGQNVNKVSSAVRLRHIPTGITIAVQSERTQGDNRAKALELLKTKLYMQKLSQRKEELQGLRGELKEAEWGSQIRSYIFHPYQMVKDHRTEIETSQVDSVLDGNLDEFVEAEIRKLSR